MSSVLESIDIYRIKPNFFIKKGDSIPSKIGAALSIITILSSLALVISTLIVFFNDNKYTMTFSQEYSKFYQLNFSKEKFFFNFFTGFQDEIPDLDRIIEFSPKHLNLNTSDPSKPYTETKLKVEKCSEHQYTVNDDDTIDPTPEYMNQFYCLQGLTNKTSIYGDESTYFSKGKVAYVKIDYLRCVNTSKNNNTCFSNEIIDSYLDKIRFILGTDDYDINHDLPGDPFKPKSYLHMFGVESNEYRKIYFLKKELIYKSDEGLFSSYFDIYSHPSFDFSSIETNSLSRSKEPNAFLSVYIFTSGKREIYTRRYQKIQEALTIVSAILNFMKVLCGLVVGLVGDKIFFEQLINSMLFGVGKECNYYSSSSGVNEIDKEKRFNYMEIKRELFCSKSESRYCFNGNNGDDVNENNCGKIVNNDNVNDNENDISGWNRLKSIISVNNSYIQSKYQKKILASRLNDNNINYNDTNNVRKENEESSCRNK